MTSWGDNKQKGLPPCHQEKKNKENDNLLYITHYMQKLQEMAILLL